MMAAPQALLYALMNPPADAEDEFNAWYDEEHVPDRLTVPGILNGRRYRAAEANGPRYLACYDLEDVSTLRRPEYLRLREEQSPRERDMMARIPFVDRRVYHSIDNGEPWAAPWTEHAPFVLSMAMEPPPELVDDFHAWYAEEHSPMLMEVDGWRRIRRFELVEGTGARFLALHELESLDVFETDAYKAAIGTPWRERVRLYTSRRERLAFRLLRGFSP
jgi:hypothetical protein